LKDHLGNSRVTFADLDNNGTINPLAEILQENHYYPFGLNQEGKWLNNAALSDTKYQYNGKELNEDLGLNWNDYGARWYDAAIGRWTSVDVLAEKNNFESPYVYVHNNSLKYIDPDGKDGILIVFPDYKISTPAGKIGGLGHGGVLLIDNKTGTTKYYEYGRYDSEGKGLVRTISVPNVKIGSDGKPTQQSLDKALGVISKKSGHGTRVEGAYVKSDNFGAMKSYAEAKMKENNDADRKPYSLTSNNCATFACDVLKQDSDVKDNAPLILDPRPNSVIEEYQGTFEKVEYNPKLNSTNNKPQAIIDNKEQQSNQQKQN
jgi:RHS repeat-associated protein